MSKAGSRTTRRLILASSSPRRVILMRQYGYQIEVIIPSLQEPARLPESLAPAQHAEALSHFKAQSVADGLSEGWILAGDTIAALNDRIFGKPANREDAKATLTALIGTVHEVITGVTLLDASTGARLIRHDVTRVTMKAMGNAELMAFLETGEWSGKAGAYGIQESDDPFVDRIDGSFTNVVGFPMELVTGMLSEWGVQPCRESTDPAP